MRLPRLSVVLLALIFSGCTTLESLDPRNMYLHDEERLARAKAGLEMFEQARTGDLWDTMSTNLDLANAENNKRFRKAMEVRFDGMLVGLGLLPWRAVWQCGEVGDCNPINHLPDADDGELRLAISEIKKNKETFDSINPKGTTVGKLEQAMTDVAFLSEKITILGHLIQTDPNGDKKIKKLPAGEITCPMSLNDSDQKRKKGELIPFRCSFILLQNIFKENGEKIDAEVKKLIQKMANSVKAIIPTLSIDSARRDNLKIDIDNTIVGLHEVKDKVQVFRKKVDKIDNLLPEQDIGKLTSAIADVSTGTVSRFIAELTDFDEVLVIADGLITDLDNVVDAALAGDQVGAPQLVAVIDILRKSENLDLLKLGTLKELLNRAANHMLPEETTNSLKMITGKDLKTITEVLNFLTSQEDKTSFGLEKLSVAKLLEKLKKEKLSNGFQEALSKHTNTTPPIQTIEQLLTYLTTSESAVEEVRLSLLADARKALVETRAAELAELEVRLDLKKRLVKVLKEQAKNEKVFVNNRKNIEKYTGYVDESTPIVTTLRNQRREYLSPDQTKQPKIRNEFGSTIKWLAQYMARVGHLRDAEHLLQVEETAVAHRFSILRSRVAAQAREQLIARGLGGLVGFSEGGITSDDLAGVINIIQSGLLGGVIATQ